MTPTVENQLKSLGLTWVRANLDAEVAEAIRHQRPHHELLERLLAGELAGRQSRAIERRLRQARLTARPTLGSFDFQWPKRINAEQVRHLFTLSFMRNATNVVFIGGVGVGKSHLATALAVEACEQRLPVLFTPAAAMLNDLNDASAEGTLTKTIKRYLQPQLLVIDELGYLPVDKLGAELLFQVLSGRYERASTVITTNRIYKDWNTTFANDNAMTAAVLDRVVHHCETVLIEGDSYRLKDRLDHHN